MHGGLDSRRAPRAPLAARARPTSRLLRFITCGSVDDGKSTLIGRLLYDADLAPDDLLAALERIRRSTARRATISISRCSSTASPPSASRASPSTSPIAISRRSRRKFIVADTPGHEQYTRNMATGASTADLAILLVDARKGILPQTRRHSVIVSMLGVRHVVVAVNKMDLVDYREETFARDRGDFREFAEASALRSPSMCMPLVAKDGDNLVHGSDEACPGIHGPPLLAYLESVAIEDVMPRRAVPHSGAMGEPAQSDFRGFSGFIGGGNIRPGDIVRILPGGRDTRIARIVTYRRRSRQRRRRPVGDADASPRKSTARAAICSFAGVAGEGRRPAGRRSSYGWCASRSHRQELSAQDRTRRRRRRFVKAVACAYRDRERVSPRRWPMTRDARLQRDRRSRAVARNGGRLRPLCRESRDRRLHPHRPHHQ